MNEENKMYPKPDRSNQTQNFVKNDENDAIDLGWGEGLLTDGRPYHAECWAQFQVTMVTFFFSSKGIEDFTDVMLKELLSEEGLRQFLSEDLLYIQAVTITDASGNELWSVNVVIGTDDGLVAKDSVEFKNYDRTSK